MRNKLIILAILICSWANSFAQKYSEESLRTVLDSMALNHEGLDNKLQLNVSGLQLSELVNSVALENNLNISVDPALDERIAYNFYDAQVKDMLVFVYLNFEVEFDFVGSIISIRKRLPKEPAAAPPKKIDIKYNRANKFLSVNLRNDTLWQVAEKLTKETGMNFVIAPDIRDRLVNAYFLNRPMDEVLNMFVKSNELRIIPEENFYSIEKKETENLTQGNQNSGGRNNGRNPRNSNGRNNYESNSQSGDFELKKNEVGTLDIFARDVELSTLIQAAAEETGVHYILYSDLKGKSNLDVEDIRFDELMKHVFEGTDYSIENKDGIYLIGENKQDGLRTTELLRLDNRTIESVKAAIPKDLTEGVEILEFPELNGLILTGARRKIEQLEGFISEIDVIVPMVQIDVMILLSSKTSDLNTGITAGLGDAPTTSKGTVFPGLDMTFGAQSINSVLQAINGFGVLNLGQVTENFFVSLEAAEKNGMVDIKSTPKISTLNGHEASISVGNKTHYQQKQINVQTSLANQGIYSTENWTPIDANLSVNIKPFVSSDEHVTLTITVEQNEFAGKQSATAPPNMETRSFSSMVRVKNGELILLGGLEYNRKNDEGSGTPLISRVPVLKWLFSSRSKSKERRKMHVLIRPTVTY